MVSTTQGAASSFNGIHANVQQMFLRCAKVVRCGVEGGNYDDAGKAGVSLVSEQNKEREQFFEQVLPGMGVEVEDRRVSAMAFFGENRLMGQVANNIMRQEMEQDAGLEQAPAAKKFKGPSLG